MIMKNLDLFMLFYPKLSHLLYSTSTRPSLRICWPMPLLAMAMNALLLRTKSVWLLLLRSVNITVVPALLQRVVFLHLICRIEEDAHDYFQNKNKNQWRKCKIKCQQTWKQEPQPAPFLNREGRPAARCPP